MNHTTTRTYLTGAARREVMDYIANIAVTEAPVTIRHLFYRAATAFPDRIPKTDSGARKINRMVNDMRWDGAVDWWSIRDSSRHPVFAGGYSGVGDFLSTHANAYRVNAWEHLPDSVTVWCEAESALGMIDGMCSGRGVDIYPCRGQPSNDFLFRAVKYISGDTAADGTAHLLYVGDWDKEGREIPETIVRKLQTKFSEQVNFTFEFKRLAVTEEQIEEHRLPLKPGKHADLTVELEAMPGPLLRQIIADEIDQQMPAHMRRMLEITESEEKEGLRRLAAAINGGTSIREVADMANLY